MDLASAYVLYPLTIVCPIFQTSPVKDVQSHGGNSKVVMRTREPDWETETENRGMNLVDLSDRVHSKYRTTFILKGRVRGGQER
jgi:hypothetical protein